MAAHSPNSTERTDGTRSALRKSVDLLRPAYAPVQSSTSAAQPPLADLVNALRREGVAQTQTQGLMPANPYTGGVHPPSSRPNPVRALGEPVELLRVARVPRPKLNERPRPVPATAVALELPTRMEPPSRGERYPRVEPDEWWEPSRPGPRPAWEVQEDVRPAARAHWLMRALRVADRVMGALLLPVFHPKLRWATLPALAILAWTSFDPTTTSKDVQLPWRDRVAFQWEEGFGDPSNAWSNASAVAAAGAETARVRGLALYKRAVKTNNYEVSFAAKTEKSSIGWVLGAVDPQNYHVFKLTRRSGSARAAGGGQFDLVRYSVAGGVARDSKGRERIPVNIPPSKDSFLNISTRVLPEQVVTTINGYGVDNWNKSTIRAGRVGLVADKGESFLVKSLAISGNDDLLGRFLQGAEETFRAVRGGLTNAAGPEPVEVTFTIPIPE